MSQLVLHVGAEEVSAGVTGRDGQRVTAPLVIDHPRPGYAELAPEALWRAVLQVAGRLDTDRVGTGAITGVGLSGRVDTLLVWDHETLGAPRPAMAATDRRAAAICERLTSAEQDRLAQLSGLRPDASQPGPRLAWLAEHEAHTWALVEAGRYAVGPPTSYLLARMTRGLWHVTDPATATATGLADRSTGDWSPEAVEILGLRTGSLAEALPEVLPEDLGSRGPIARTDPRVFLGMDLPVTTLTLAPAGPDPAG